MLTDLAPIDKDSTEIPDLPRLKMPWKTTIAFGLAIIVGVALAYWGLYPRVSGPMPTHFDGGGNPDNWAAKTPRAFVEFIAIGPGIIWLIHLGCSAVVVAIGNNLLGDSHTLVQKRVMGWAASRLNISYTNQYIVALGTIVAVMTCGSTVNGGSALTLWGGLILIVLATFVFIGAIGVGTQRIRELILDPEEAAHWKWGFLYNNPDDPQVLVDTGTGTNYIFNVGTREG